MNIALVSQEYPPESAHGGIGTQTWNKAAALTKLGHVVHVLSCASGDGPELRSEVIDGTHVHRMRPPGKDFEVNHDEIYALGYSWQVLGHLRRLMAEQRFDIVNFPEYGGEGFAFQLDRTTWNWTPTITQLHGPVEMLSERTGWPEPDSEFKRVLSFMESTSARLADWLMASSANIADWAAARYGLPRDRIDVVHTGIDTAIFRPTKRPPDSAPTVLFVGNIDASKGVNVVVNAVLRVAKEFPQMRLKLLGKGEEDDLNAIRQRASEAGFAANIEILGFIRDRSKLPAIYQSADVFASPSPHECGLANVYVEAMACGVPVITANTGGAPEAVIDGECGLLVPPDDVDAMTNALRRLFSDTNLCRRMGLAARQRVENYFALEHYIARVLAAYQKAIARSQERLAEEQAS